MGSSCSSRQSTKDNTSEHSDEYKPDGEKGKLITPSGADKTSADPTLDKTKETKEPSSGNNGGAAGVGSAISAKKGASADLSRGKSIEERQPSVSEDLPDLTSFQETTRNLLEGKVTSPVTEVKAEGICLCLVGDALDSGADRKALETHITKEISGQLDSTCRDFWVLNIDTDCLEAYSLDRGHLLTDYIKEQTSRNLVFNFVFLSDTVGQLRPPPLILKSDFDPIVNSLEKDEDKELVKKWYKEDALASRPFVKLNWTMGVPSKDFSADFDKISSALMASSNDKIKEHYLKTPLEQTIEGLFDKGEGASSIIWVKREGENDKKKAPPTNGLSPEEDKERTQKLTKLLSDSIPQEKTICTEKKSSEEAFLKSISFEIEKLIKNSSHNGKHLPNKSEENKYVKEGLKVCLLKEISHHQEFCKSQKTKNAPKTKLLEDIRKYLNGASSNVLVIRGDEGSGKSFLAASVATHCHEWTKPGTCLVQRFIGTSENSSSFESLLYYLYEHCLLLYGTSKTPWDPTNMPSNLAALWEKATSLRPLVVILDGLDHLKHGDVVDYDWLNRKLPSHVKVILTVRSESDICKSLIAKDHTEHIEIKIDVIEESENILKNMMSEANKKFPSSILEKLKSSNPSPLQLLILSRLSMILERDEDISCCSLNDVIECFLQKLMSIFKKGSVEKVLGCLALTRIGLTEGEIISILRSSNAQPEDNNSFTEWLLLRRVLRPLLHIREENCLWVTCFSSLFAQKVQSCLLGPKDLQSTCLSALQKCVLRSSIDKLLETFDPDEYATSVGSVRTLQENSISRLPGPEALKLVASHKYLFLKLLSCGPTQVSEDVKLVLEKNPGNKGVSLLKDFFAVSFPSLAQDVSQFYIQFYGRLKWHASAEGDPLISSMLKDVAKSPQMWISPLSSCFAPLGQPGGDQPTDAKMSFNFLFKIPSNTDHVVSVSTDKGELTVWDILNVTPVRTLKGINQPRKLEMIDENKCLLLCGRELRIYDLNKGEFLMKLREVMNQKMPFFGLHNSDHVVALSRSRMYVNMMNLTEGNCVTTFKVGEDRFLSSLNVSENGKICVCGDDSQKPSALLVWDLERRKLLYDLRIPHHGFIMKLVAITQEGHYVCSVCREIDEPAPNFIVVYDLQSGTLFKRWKPAVNTISITISTAGNCVIVGLENADVMAYDLITGNPRWTAHGHYFPPDTFKLDQEGSFLLSYDSEGRDMSLRAWDVSSGKSLAVLTPDQKIVSTEVTCEGKVIVLALEGHSSLFTFVLRSHEGTLDKSTIKAYGDVELSGKCFDLGQAQGT